MEEDEKAKIKERLYKAFAKYGLEEIKNCRHSCEHYSRTTLMLYNMIQSVDVINQKGELNSSYIALVYKYVDSALKHINA